MHCVCSLGQVATGFRCLGLGKTLKAIRVTTTSTDGFRAALFVVRVGNEYAHACLLVLPQTLLACCPFGMPCPSDTVGRRAHVFQESFFLDYPALPTKLLDLADSIVAKATVCAADETVVVITTTTSNLRFSEGTGDSSVVIKGANKDSPALPLGKNYQLGEVRE